MPLPPLATVADLAGITDAPTDQSVITVAGELIRNLCDWHICPSITETRQLDGPGGVLLTLPSGHVTDVASVTEVAYGEVITDWRLLAGGRVLRGSGYQPFPYGGYYPYSGKDSFEWGWRRGIANYEVTFTHGYDVIPDDLKGVLISLAESVGETPVGIRGEVHTTGNRSESVTYFAEGTYQGGSGLPPAISAVLSLYKAHW